MRAGDLDRRVTIEAVTIAPDSAGQAVEVWTAIATVWAAVWQLSATERAARPQAAAEEVRRFRIRWASAFTPTPGGHRIVFAGRAYDIQAVAEIGRREGWDITATARV